MPFSFRLICVDCGKAMADDTFTYVCPSCHSKSTSHAPPKGMLKTLYDYDALTSSSGFSADALISKDFAPLLPLKNIDSLGVLKVGKTPLYRFDMEYLDKTLSFWLKDDAQNPTFSFKDRASALVSAYSREQGIHTIVAASTGNAGSSLAGICASQKQDAVIMVPKTAPAAKLLQIIMYGATPVLVDGNYDAAFDLSLEATQEFGWLNRNTAYNPFTIEGKKTVSFELYQKFGKDLPDYIFVSAGDGVILSGLYKGFEDLLMLGLIEKIPCMVAVQSQKSDNLIRNLDQEDFVMQPATTLADSISVDFPRNFFMARSFLHTYKGKGISVSDEEIMESAYILARNTGIFAEPASAAAMAGMLKFVQGYTKKDLPEMLVLNTGSGLKDIQTPMKNLSLPEAVQPNLTSLKTYLQKARPQVGNS